MKITNEFYMEGGVIKEDKFFPKGKTEGETICETAIGPKPFRPSLQLHRVRPQPETREPLRRHPRRAPFVAALPPKQYLLSTGQGCAVYPADRAFGDDKAVCDSFESMKEHLAGAAKLNLETATYRLGRRLTFDAQAEKFVGDPEANTLLSRQYRSPYVVPEQV